MAQTADTSMQPPLWLRCLPEGMREHVAAHLPELIAQRMTLGNEWYDRNGHFKYAVGDKIDCKGPQYFGYGLNPQGWTVVGHTDDGNYEIETADGERQTHFKWNIENQFRPADPNAKPFDPNRFSPESARNLGKDEAA